MEFENDINQNTEIEPTSNVAPGSDVEMIEVNTPNFFGRHFLHLLAVFGMGFLSFLFIFEIYLTPIYIVGQSMQPNINISSTGSNDQTHNDLVYYRAKSSYAVGDVIIVDSQNYLPTLGSSIIKRVVATGGSTVSMEFYRISMTTSAMYVDSTIHAYYNLYVNGVLLNENYIKEQTCYITFTVNRATKEYLSSSNYKLIVDNIYPAIKERNPGVWTAGDWASVSTDNPLVCTVNVEQNQLFACGDNRNNSTDCRYFGPVNVCDVLGNVRILVPYGSNMFVAIWHKIFG